MAAAIGLREDYVGDDLRRLGRGSRDGRQVRRLLALAAIYDGASRTEAARIGGVTLQIVRDWVVRFNAEGPVGLIDRKAPGKAPTLGPEARAALAVAAGPKPYLDGVVRASSTSLQWLWERFGLSVSRQTLGRRAAGDGRGPSSPPGRGTTRRIRRPRTSSKRMARPVCKRFVKLARDQSAQTYPVWRAVPAAKMELRASRAS
jgi:transposase